MEKLNVAPGDFNWFTKMPEYITWYSAEYAELLWYAGDPNSGKTMLLQSLVDKLLNSQRGRAMEVAYFFCVESAPAEQTASESQILPILRSVICQLLAKDHERIAVVQRNSKRENGLEELLNSHTSTPETLWGLLQHAIKAVQDQKVHIIIDGIDKMKAEDQTEFLKRLLKLLDTLPRSPACFAKFLFSSRPSSEIRDILKGVPLIDENIERKRQYFEFLSAILLVTKICETDCLNSLFFGELHARRNKVSEPQRGTYQWIWKHRNQAYYGFRESQEVESLQVRMIQRTLLDGPNEAQIVEPDPIVADFFYSARGGASEIGHRWMLQSLLH